MKGLNKMRKKPVTIKKSLVTIAVASVGAVFVVALLFAPIFEVHGCFPPPECNGPAQPARCAVMGCVGTKNVTLITYLFGGSL
jgi:hypothetical protein